MIRVLLHLTKKDTAFRYIDTHAGSGAYDLSGTEAGKTEEWRAGLGRLLACVKDWPSEAQALIEPYLRLAAPAAEAPGPLYPGSPAIAAALLRRQDRMIFCELHPLASEELREGVGRDRRAKTIEIDGFAGLKAFLPPPERRGVVLIDPAFEAKDEFERGLGVLEAAYAKWRTGIFLLWYPVKDPKDAERALQRFAATKVKRVLRLELQVADPLPLGPLVRTGLLIVNQPFPLVAEVQIILPLLARALADGPGAGHAIEWLAGE